MISDKHFATLRVSRVIFHDVPKNPKGAATSPTLSDIESTIDPSKVHHLKSRLTRALRSKNAYDIQFKKESGSAVPELVTSYLKGRRNSEDFVELSRKLAIFLHEHHTGANSSGLLTVLEALSDGHNSLLMLKLEREEGAQLSLSEKDGKKTFEMSVLDNLVLTEGTRLFKSAMFVMMADGGISAVGCDDQRTFGTGEELAQFWMRFLGCELTQKPKVVTKQFFEASVSFINFAVEDPIEKNTIYEHLLSQYKSEKLTFSPKEFILDYIPETYKQAYENHLKDQKVSLKQFPLDISDVNNRLRRRVWQTSRGAMVTVPDDEEILVTVDGERITVQDRVIKVDRP